MMIILIIPGLFHDRTVSGVILIIAFLTGFSRRGGNI